MPNFIEFNIGVPMICGTRCIIFSNGFVLRYQRIFELYDLLRYLLLLILGTVILLALKNDEFRLTDCLLRLYASYLVFYSENLGYMQNGTGRSSFL